MSEPRIRAIAPWFGAGRTIAPHVGRALDGCAWVGVPFAGGMSELHEITARTIVVNDLHRHVVNLAYVIALDHRELARRLNQLPFHPDVLLEAQEWCSAHEPNPGGDIRAAMMYFVCVWMGRSHKAGTEDEFNSGLSRRWNANGGDSNTRYRSAVRSLVEWQRIMRRCSFDTLDAFEFLAHCEDATGHGLYIDAPWPDDGAKYRHKFSEDDQRRLAQVLSGYQKCRVVIRYGDHPLIRELYPESKWQWQRMEGRTQTNETKQEVLIVNRAARSGRLFE